MQQDEPAVVIIPTSIAQETDVVDIFLNKTNEENGLPEKQAPEEKIDEEIEVEKEVSSPLKEMQVEPSGSNKEDDKVEGGAKCFPRKYDPVHLIWCPYPDGG